MFMNDRCREAGYNAVNFLNVFAVFLRSVVPYQEKGEGAATQKKEKRMNRLECSDCK